MSPLESRAWLCLWSMCPAYAVYFAVQVGWPDLFTTLLGRIGFLAAIACIHAAIYVAGLLVLKWRERGEGLLVDERDRAIDTRATRATRGAYFVLLAGTILVGMVMPFSDHGWKIVNTALLFIVLSEALRNGLIILGYRGTVRLVR